MKTITIFIAVLISLALVGAIYEGETTSINLAGTFDNLTNITFVGNTSPIDFTVDNLIVNITIPTIYDSGNFSIRFGGWSNGAETTQTVNEDVGGGCTTTWTCSDYGTCINNSQSRTCSKVISYCYAKPVNLTQSCTPVVITPVNNSTTNNSNTNSSVPPISSNSNTLLYIVIGILIAVVIIVIYFIFRPAPQDLNSGGGWD